MLADNAREGARVQTLIPASEFYADQESFNEQQNWQVGHKELKIELFRDIV